MEIQAEISEIENIQAVENQKSKNWLFEQINIEKPLTRLINKNIKFTKNERKSITHNTTDTKYICG